MEYCSLRGRMDNMNLPVLKEIADYFEKDIGYAIPPQTPFMGAAFCATRAGIHADGLLKDMRIYSIFDTEAILNRPPEVLVDAHSGAAGVAHWLNNHTDRQVDKKDPLVQRMKAAIDRHFAGGRTTVLTNEELLEIYRTSMEG